MTLCSISTFVFNANPLMKFDGYYMLADWLEIPNLRDRANRYLTNLFKEISLGVEVQPEPYMALNRRILFVVYAITAYVYRWVVTFSIIYTLSNFLKPYKLGTLSKLLAIAALGSMVIWPAYRGIKAWQQRGRLPDMKSNRVTITSIIAFLIILFFFLCPLPVSRVSDKGLVELQPEHSTRVYLPLKEGATLQRIAVEEGDLVERGQLIAVFYSEELESQRMKAQQEKRSQEMLADSLRQTISRATTPEDRKRVEQLVEDARQKALSAGKHEVVITEVVDALSVRAPRAGVAVGVPKKEDVGKFWEDASNRPVCTVGDVHKLRVLMPIATYDYKLLQEDMAASGGEGQLDVSMRTPGSGWRVYHGKLRSLPSADARNVPMQLTFRGGGSLATKPGGNDPNAMEPQNQVYLLEIEIDDPDGRIQPGLLPFTKIHCQWRSLAWYVWRKIHIAFDLSL